MLQHWKAGPDRGAEKSRATKIGWALAGHLQAHRCAVRGDRPEPPESSPRPCLTQARAQRRSYILAWIPRVLRTHNTLDTARWIHRGALHALAWYLTLTSPRPHNPPNTPHPQPHRTAADDGLAKTPGAEDKARLLFARHTGDDRVVLHTEHAVIHAAAYALADPIRPPRQHLPTWCLIVD